MVEDRVIRAFLHCHALQVVADEVQSCGAGVKVVHHLDPLSSPKFRPMIRTDIEWHRRFDLVRRNTKWVRDRRPVWPITIRNFLT
jgi:hypothetical protein